MQVKNPPKLNDQKINHMCHNINKCYLSQTLPKTELID